MNQWCRQFENLRAQYRMRRHIKCGHDANADKSADGIGIVDVSQEKLTGKPTAGSDPEEFSLSRDVTRPYIANEDVKTASVVNIAGGKGEHIILVGQEPEGVAPTPDGKLLYAANGPSNDVSVVDLGTDKEIARVKAGASPWRVVIAPHVP